MLETMREHVGHAIGGTLVAAPLEYAIDTAYGVRHPDLLRSGATRDEETTTLPGDDLVAEPMWVATRAETIQAPAATVWALVVQMGYGRGGYYAYSFFDPRHDADARGIVAGLQDLKVGDVLLDGPGCDASKGAWKVAAIEPERALVLHSLRDPISGRELDPADRGGKWLDCSWAFVLERVDAKTTRLLVRTRVRLEPAWGLVPARFVFGAGDTVWQRTMLRGVKERAERATARAKTKRAPAKRRTTKRAPAGPKTVPEPEVPPAS